MAATSLNACVYLYALLDPRDKNPRYVGKSVRHPSLRVSEHLSRARKRIVAAHKGAWLRLLDRLDMSPALFILERCPASVWQEREKFWIRHLREKGYDLLNVSLGGDGGGMQGQPLSAEHKRRISEANKGRVVTQETRQRISAGIKALNGSYITEGTRAKWRRQRAGQQNAKGHVLSKESKERIRCALRGRHPTEAARANMRLGHQRNPQTCPEWLKSCLSQERQKLTPEETNEIRRLAENGETYRALSISYGVGKSTIGRIVRRERYCDGAAS